MTANPDTKSVPTVHRIKLVTVGDTGVGKSSVVLRFTDNEFKDCFNSTICIDFKVKMIEMDNKTVCRVQIWDTAGQEKYRNITNAYYRFADGILLIYDITDRDTFLNVRYWLQQIQQHLQDKNPIIILLSNKCDLKKQRTVSYNEGKILAEEYNISFYETSAKNEINIKNVFLSLTNEIIKHSKQSQTKQQNDSKIIRLHKKFKTKLKTKTKCKGC